MTVVVPDLAELFEEAYERAGLIMRSGYDLKTARRSLNILTLEWQNRGLNLFTIESGTLALTQGTATFTMPANTIDLISINYVPVLGHLSKIQLWSVLAYLHTRSRPTRTQRVVLLRCSFRGSLRPLQ